MKVLLSWLREFAPFSAHPLALAESMSALGMAVESYHDLGRALDGIVVARVKDLRPHPKAEKVQRVDVDPGDGGVIQVWCGAFNMEVGDLVPLAPVGTVMPNGIEIGRRKILGEYSEGMLCSPAELGLGGDARGIMILPEGLKPGTPLKEALDAEGDVLYDLEINPNRPDAMSMAGVARDLAGRHHIPFALAPSPVLGGGPPVEELATVEVLDPERCGRFVAKVLQGVSVEPSPVWMANRLALLGMRPINNVVDVSNYVMLEVGAPNHAYDLARVAGRGLRVRRAQDGETLVTLDDVERRFTSEDLLICDGEDRAIGIAGIMGGADSEISGDTTEVLLEVAWWQPMPIAKSSRRLGLRTEASARFERGTDSAGLDLAATRFVELLGTRVSTIATGTIDVRGQVPERPRVRLRMARVNSILGINANPLDTTRDLERIGFEVSAVEEKKDELDVLVPSFRPDTSTEIDVIEEVARHWGYDAITPVVPPSVHVGGLTPRQRRRRLVRQALVGLGYDEAMPLPFLAPGDLARSGLPDDGITITNPLVAEESVLRTSLLPGLLRAVAYNASHRNHGVGLWEIGHIVLQPREALPLPDEREHVAAALAASEAPAAVEAVNVVMDVLGFAYDLEAASPPGLHATRSATVHLNGTVVGVVGEVDPDVLGAHGIPERVAWFELDLGRLLDMEPPERRYGPVSRYPSSDIDLAFEVDEEVPAAAVARALREAGGELLVDLELFDVYRGAGLPAGRRSLAYRLRFQALDRTLTDVDVAAVRARCIEAVESTLPAKLRG